MGFNPTCVPLRGRTTPKVRHEPAKHRDRAETPRAIAEKMRAVARGQEPWPLFMWGPSGVGKSYAALALLDYVEGITHYWTAEALCEHLIACDQGGVRIGTLYPVVVSRWDYWRGIQGSQLVVLDELGTRTGPISDHHAEVVKRVLDLREGKPLIVLSNLRASDLQSIYEDRITSRATAGTIIDWSGYPDRRLEHHARAQVATA